MVKKRGYHHGNLRQALVDAALDLIEAKGPTGFTLSEAAKTAGVTPAAVYRHFEGREDLIAEIAQQGYAVFGDLLDYAYSTGQPSALASFEAVGRAYLAFARKYPGHYVAMFESSISIQRTPELYQSRPRQRGSGTCRRRAVKTHPRRKPSAATDVCRPYLGDEPRRGRTLCPQQPRHQKPLSPRGSVGNRHRHLPARFGIVGKRRLRFAPAHLAPPVSGPI